MGSGGGTQTVEKAAVFLLSEREKAAKETHQGPFRLQSISYSAALRFLKGNILALCVSSGCWSGMWISFP